MEAAAAEGEIRFGHMIVDGRQVHYAEAGDATRPAVLFVHGTPGSWQGFDYYLRDRTLRETRHLIAIDRPGFGRSTDGDWLPDLANQSRIIMQAATLNESGQPLIVVGHSLGGTSAIR